MRMNENESTNASYKVSQEEETYYIIVVYTIILVIWYSNTLVNFLAHIRQRLCYNT